MPLISTNNQQAGRNLKASMIISTSRKQLLETSWIYKTNVEDHQQKDHLKTEESGRRALKKLKRKFHAANLNTSASAEENGREDDKGVTSTGQSPAVGVRDSVEQLAKKINKKKKLADASVDSPSAEQGNKSTVQVNNHKDTQNKLETKLMPKKTTRDLSGLNEVKVSV